MNGWREGETEGESVGGEGRGRGKGARNRGSQRRSEDETTDGCGLPRLAVGRNNEVDEIKAFSGVSGF